MQSWSRKSPALRALAVLAAVGLGACVDDEAAGPVSLEVAPPAAAAAAQDPNAPRWKHLSDEELAREVERAGGRVFIGFKEPGQARGVSEKGKRLIGPAAIARSKADLRARGVAFEMEFEPGMPTVVGKVAAADVATLRRLPFVDYVEPIFPGVRHAQTTPWNVTRVRTPDVWSLRRGANWGVLVIDSGIDSTHADVTATQVYRCAGVGNYDHVGHGTLVSGVVRATDNTIGVVGNAPSVKLYVAKDGDAQPDPAGTLCGINWAMGLVGANIAAVNISSGYPAYQALTDAIYTYYHLTGVVFVASAGNSGGAISYPASLPEVIAVGATNSSDVLATFSSRGSDAELVAPGVGVYTTKLGNSYDTVDGTSFSAPAVAAIAALVREDRYNRALSTYARDVRARLRATARDLGTTGWDTSYGYGIVDAYAAIYGTLPSVSISGPTNIPYSAACTWTASASNGVAPYTYVWRIDGSDQATGSTFADEHDEDYYYLYVVATDAVGQQFSTYVTVSKSSTGSC